MTPVCARRTAVWVVVTLLPIGACTVSSSGSGGLGAVSVGFSETIFEYGLALIVLIGCGFFFWNRRR